MNFAVAPFSIVARLLRKEGRRPTHTFTVSTRRQWLLARAQLGVCTRSKWVETVRRLPLRDRVAIGCSRVYCRL